MVGGAHEFVHAGFGQAGIFHEELAVVGIELVISMMLVLLLVKDIHLIKLGMLIVLNVLLELIVI